MTIKFMLLADTKPYLLNQFKGQIFTIIKSLHHSYFHNGPQKAMIVKKPYGVLPCLGGNDMTFSHIRNVHKNFAFICSLSLELVVHAFLDITYRHHLTLRHTETFCAGLYLEMFLLHFHSHFWVELDVLKIQFIILSMVKNLNPLLIIYIVILYNHLKTQIFQT